LYGLAPEHWKEGLATEACVAALDYLWRSTAFPRVYARADRLNQRSIQVMQRLGMTHAHSSDSLVTFMLERPR
jgi:RimJ/RimL family protein N-acetyltransferase